MKKVLIVTYYWPPGSNPGVLRMLKTCKYLPEFGWQPVILTVKDGSYPSVDETLEGKVDSSVKVFKTQSWEPFRLFNFLTGKKGNTGTVGMANIKDSKGLISRLSLWVRANIFIPDARVGWVPFAYKRAKKLIEEEGIDVVFTTGPPQSTHLVGLKLKKKLGISWVMDLRDPWTGIYYNKFLPRTRLARNKDKDLEVEAVSAADYITTVSKGLKNEFWSVNKNIELIYNGFDEDDFKFEPVSKPKNKFRVCFFGNLLPNQDIDGLWKGIKTALEAKKELAVNFELIFVGNVHEEILVKLQKLMPGTTIDKRPYMPHSEAVKMMSSVDVLLFIIPDAEDNELILTGKLFEYLASGSEILAVGPVMGEASRVLIKSNRGEMYTYEDIEGIKNELLCMFERKIELTGKPTHQRNRNTLFYSRRNQTERLAGVLNQIIGKSLCGSRTEKRQ